MELHIGSWVAVRYFGYTLSVDVKVNDECLCHARFWKSLEIAKCEDHMFCARKDVLQKLEPLIVAGIRGQFTFKYKYMCIVKVMAFFHARFLS